MTSDEFSPVERQRVLDWLSVNVPESRLKHVLRVEEMAIALATQHQVCAHQAAQAALMHDLAKYFKPERLLDMARQENLTLDPVLEANPHLLHADVSALVARDEFGMEHGGVLKAIANHTLGKPDMDALSCIIFLADSLEPGRGKSAELNALRAMAWKNLDYAVWMTCDHAIKQLLHLNRLIHPRAIETRNWFLQRATGQSVQSQNPLECGKRYAAK